MKGINPHVTNEGSIFYHLQKVVGTNTKTSISTEWEVTPPFRIALAM
jgi:hypothetical protein